MAIQLHTVVVRAVAGGQGAWSNRADLRGGFAFLMPFTLVLYLALRGGGYDPIVRGEFGFVIWCIVLLGAAAGLISAAGWTRSSWVVVGLFVAFMTWTGLAI